MNQQTGPGLRIILTGASGMVGEGVLYQCLTDITVEAVLVIGRRSCGIVHPKLKEWLLADFFELSQLEKEIRLQDYEACFFCLGVSSVGMKEPEYFRLTHTLTLNFATILSRKNPRMIFCYISGTGTDSSEKGRMMWARVKGKTENDLDRLPFRKVYHFRPGILSPVKGGIHTLPYYKYLGWLLPVIRLFAPHHINSLRQLGSAMIEVAAHGYDKTRIEVTDILILSRKTLSSQS